MKMKTQEMRDKFLKRINTVGQIIAERPYLTFYTEESIENIVREMHTQHQGVVGIKDATGRLVGIMTERDILRKIFGVLGESQDDYDERHHSLSIYPEKLTAWDVMVTNPKCLTEDMPVEKALDKIKEYGFRFMPVVKKDNKRKLTGIVSERELFWHTQEKIRRTVKSQESLLSYFMHHESYGGAGGASIDNGVMH
jgi:CBS domain-containing protein